MALYLGNDKIKRKIILNGVKYNLNLISKTPTVNGVRLLSSDGYILKDKNSVYLTVKEGN